MFNKSKQPWKLDQTESVPVGINSGVFSQNHNTTHAALTCKPNYECFSNCKLGPINKVLKIITSFTHLSSMMNLSPSFSTQIPLVSMTLVLIARSWGNPD